MTVVAQACQDYIVRLSEVPVQLVSSTRRT